MLNRKVWFAFYGLALLLLGASYSYLTTSIRTFSNQLEIEANQRLAERADGSLEALESALRANQLDKVREILKQIGKNERVACASVMVGSQIISSPEPCNIKFSDRTIVVGSEAGTLVKIDTGLTLWEELSAKINLTFLLLFLGYAGILALFSLLFSMSLHWISGFFIKKALGPNEANLNSSSGTVFFDSEALFPYGVALEQQMEASRLGSAKSLENPGGKFE